MDLFHFISLVNCFLVGKGVRRGGVGGGVCSLCKNNLVAKCEIVMETFHCIIFQI
jgi:hypothetical protein